MFGFAHCCIPNASLSACHTEGTQYLWNELLLSDVCLGAHLLVSLQPTDLAVLGGGGGGGGVVVRSSLNPGLSCPGQRLEPSPRGLNVLLGQCPLQSELAQSFYSNICWNPSPGTLGIQRPGMLLLLFISQMILSLVER